MSVTQHFPAHWRFVADVERTGGRDPKGIPLPSTFHEVPDCLLGTIASEEQIRSDDPDTTAWIYAPTGANFRANDIVRVPDSPYWLSGRFVVTGRPSPTPLGVSVPLREG